MSGLEGNSTTLCYQTNNLELIGFMNIRFLLMNMLILHSFYTLRKLPRCPLQHFNSNDINIDETTITMWLIFWSFKLSFYYYTVKSLSLKLRRFHHTISRAWPIPVHVFYFTCWKCCTIHINIFLSNLFDWICRI